MQVAFYRCLLRCGNLQFVDIFDERLLHIAKRLAQLPDFIDAFEIWQLGIELARGDSLSLLRQDMQRLQLARYDADEEEEHQQQTHDNDSYHRAL